MRSRIGSGRRGVSHWRELTILSLLLLGGLVLGQLWLPDSARRVLQAHAVEGERLGSGAKARELARRGLLHALPPRVLPAQELAWPPGAGFEDDDSDSEPEDDIEPAFYQLEPLTVQQISASLLVEERSLELGVPIVSLLVPEADLENIQTNLKQRGRKWERQALLSYFDRGELLFSSTVGVRLHGGSGRKGPARRSYRIYHRRSYGQDRFSPAIFPGREIRPVRQFVIRHNEGWVRNHYWTFHNPLAFDIARQAGVPTPATHLAVFYLNGSRLGIYALTEYINEHYLEAHFGIDEPLLVRTKQNQLSRAEPVQEGDPELYADFLAWAHDDAPLSIEEAAERIDVDNLVRWWLTILFCDVRDTFQGALALDQEDPAARWFWIAWDLDLAFLRNPREDSFRSLYLRTSPRDPRHRLLGRLLAGGPEFKAFFVDRLHEVLNHRLTDRFLEERLRHYGGLAGSFAVEDRRFLISFRRFIMARKEALFEDLARHLELGDSFEVSIRLPRGFESRIDGMSHSGGYRGRYYRGREVVVEARDATGRVVESWLVDGKPTRAPVLRLEVDGPLSVRLDRSAGEGPREATSGSATGASSERTPPVRVPPGYALDLERLQSQDDLESRRVAAHAILYGYVDKQWLELDVAVANTYQDLWTAGTEPAALVVRNRGHTPLSYRLGVVSGGDRDFPFRVSIDDGDQTREYEFSEPGQQEIDLAPAPPRSERLFLIWSDRSSMPSRREGRALGLRLKCLACEPES